MLITHIAKHIIEDIYLLKLIKKDYDKTANLTLTKMHFEGVYIMLIISTNVLFTFAR